MYSFTLNKHVGTITLHGERSDGLPETVEWRGQLFDVPDLDTLEMWSWDSVVETLEGGRIEPDGFDCNGCPSWLLALGLI